MSLYAIKDKDGELRDTSGRTAKSQFGFGAFGNYGLAKNRQQYCYPNGHVVELVEKAEPVEVSKKAGQKLAGLKREADIGDTPDPMYVWVASLREDEDMSIEDIFRALDVGWTVKQPQRWYVKAPEEWDGRRGERQRFYKHDNDSLDLVVENIANNTADEQFTAEEIERYRLGRFEKVEVED
jgi:hypothetical protein